MSVLRIVPNIQNGKPASTAAFYQEVLGLNIVMDLGWIITFSADTSASPQLSVASQGGAETSVPDVSIEVDNLDEVYQNAKKFGSEIVYDICTEEWGVRRFFVREPSGKILNIVSHQT